MKIKISKGYDYSHLYLNGEHIACDSFKGVMRRVEALYRIAGKRFPISFKRVPCPFELKEDIEFKIEGDC